MDILKAFNINGVDFDVNIEGTDDEPLFQANQIGHLLGIQNIRQSISGFDDDERVYVSTTYTPGGIKETIYLTETGLYRLLGMSRKPIARTFQKWVCQVVKEIRITGKYELLRQREVDKVLYAKRREQDRHDTLINAFKNKRVIYLTRLKNFNEEKDIIKLGWTNDIPDRQRALVTQFGGSTFQDVFECNQNQEFELFLKRHRDIAQHAYREDIIANVRSTETYLLSQTEYTYLVKIIRRNIDNYQGFSKEQLIELQHIKLEKNKIDLQKQALELLALNVAPAEVTSVMNLYITTNPSQQLQTIIGNNEIHQDVQHNLQDNIYLLENIDGIHEKEIGIPRINTRNRRVQQYDINTFDPVKTYDGIMDVIRQNKDMSKIGVKTAALKNTVYRGSRWFFLERDQDDVKYNIPPTKEIKTSIPRHIAMLNHDNTQILSVYATMTQASAAINSNRKTTIHEAITQDKLVRRQFRFKYFDDCSEELKNVYTSRHQLPNINVSKGTMIQQIELQSRQCIKTYSSIADVLKHVVIARENLKRACATGEACKGYIWKYVTFENTI